MNEEKKFTEDLLICNHCGINSIMETLSSHKFYTSLSDRREDYMWENWMLLKCPSCNKINVYKFWSIADEDQYYRKDGKDFDVEIIHIDPIFPLIDSSIPMKHELMPKGIGELYDEAKAVYKTSPRSSAALLRLAIEEFCIFLGETGKLNNMIGSLVKKGIPIETQKSFNILRIVGNNAVHPGQIDLNDNDEVAKKLFPLINEIVKTFTNEKDMKGKIDELYEKLPDKAKGDIKKRDQRLDNEE